MLSKGRRKWVARRLKLFLFHDGGLRQLIGQVQGLHVTTVQNTDGENLSDRALGGQMKLGGRRDLSVVSAALE